MPANAVPRHQLLTLLLRGRRLHGLPRNQGEGVVGSSCCSHCRGVALRALTVTGRQHRQHGRQHTAAAGLGYVSGVFSLMRGGVGDTKGDNYSVATSKCQCGICKLYSNLQAG